MFRYIALASIALLLGCSSAYNLTDRNGNTFVIEKPELEPKGNLEYRSGNATRELAIKEIVSLSIPSAEPRIFDGKVFYPATLILEDTLSAPTQGFVCVEGLMKAKNAGNKFSIPMANISEFKRSEN
jgi:hypothetical protein